MLSDDEIAQWKRDLESGDRYRQAEAAEVLAESFSADDTGYTLTVHDKLWREIDRIGDFIELTYTIPRNLAPQATLTLQADHHLVPVFRTCEQTMVGVLLETDGISEAFYVKRHREKLDEKGVWTHVIELVGIYDILNYLVIWPSWFLPIQSQPFSHAIYAAPLCTTIEAAAAEQALRIQGGINEFLNNALSLNPDVRSYFGTILQALKRDGKPSTILKTPLYVVRTGILRDGSPPYVKTVRMTTVGQMITEITPAYGVDVRVHLWRPGDPQPDPWANLEAPTYVMTVKDRSQIEGPTKSILDSALRGVVDLQGSILANTLGPLLNPDGKYAPEGLYIAPSLGINFVMPYAMIVTPDNVITEDGDVVRERSPLISCEIAHNTPLGWQHIIGGKSPKFLNDLINAFFKYVIDAVMIVIGFTGVPSNLLDGFLNDSFLAFQLIQHYARRDSVGPYHPAIEVFTATNSAPYNVEALFQFIQVLWNSRGYTTAIATFRGQNGPYKLGRDIFPGALMILVYASRTMLFTDYIELISGKVNRTTRELTVQIGDGKPLEHFSAQIRRNVSEAMAAINVVSLAPQSG
ncbi:Gp37-like protein [Mycolicibacterium sp. A43C]